MKPNRTNSLWATALLFITFSPQLSPCFAQGSLTPPGAPSPTMKTLQQVEPRTPISTLSSTFTITNSGAYYFTTNLTAPFNQDGIVIAAGNVELDLNGFTLLGSTGGSAFNGITVNAGRAHVVIRNGFVSRCTHFGVSASAATDVVIENLLVSSNGYSGIRVGAHSRVAHCQAQGNLFAATSQGGIHADNGCTISDCVVAGNNSISDGAGIFAGSYCLIEHCTVTENIGTNGSGISVGGHCTISDCNVSGNGSGNAVAVGIYAGLGSLVQRCTVNNNSGDGIVTGDYTWLSDNNCCYNGMNGISVASASKCRIDGNHLANNSGFGLNVGKTNGLNLIVRNFAANNNPTNYSIAAGNNDAALLFPGSSFSGSNPWANLSY